MRACDEHDRGQSESEDEGRGDTEDEGEDDVSGTLGARAAVEDAVEAKVAVAGAKAEMGGEEEAPKQERQGERDEWRGTTNRVLLPPVSEEVSLSDGNSGDSSDGFSCCSKSVVGQEN